MYTTPPHSTYGYYPETYQHPQYAQRVPPPPAPHHQIQRIGQVPSGSGSVPLSQGQAGYGTVFTEPRREGRTVPTSSALFDNGRDRRSNEGVAIHQPAAQPQTQPPPAPGLGAELWGKERMNGQGQGQGLGLGNSLAAGAGPNGRGIGTSNANFNINGNGVGNGETTTNGNGNDTHKDPSPTEEKPRYPSLSGFLSSTQPSAQPTTQTTTQTTSQQGQTGKISSPPKSSLGITGIPSGMPFI